MHACVYMHTYMHAKEITDKRDHDLKESNVGVVNGLKAGKGNAIIIPKSQK